MVEEFVEFGEFGERSTHQLGAISSLVHSSWSKKQGKQESKP